MISLSNIKYNELFAGATEIGPRHVHEKLPNQDAFLCRQYEYGVVIAVADGVGSEQYSQEGSKAAVNAVHLTFEKLHNEIIDSSVIAESIMEQYIIGVDPAYRTKAATTCIYAAYIYGLGLFLGQVGDGICCGNINGESFIFQPKDDEFTNIVKPLSALNEQAEWTEAFVPDDQIDAVSLMVSTDGVSEDLLPGKECGFVDYVINKLNTIMPAERNQFLHELLLNWSTPQSIDDKTFCFYSMKKGE